MGLKTTIARAVGPRGVRILKRLLGRAAFDEVELVHTIFRRLGRVGQMVDVGAHHGTALAPFVADGWKALAFEPDQLNRSHLEALYGRHKGVRIVTMAVADKPAENISFYASDVSTGISSLSAFHETHEQRHTVNITTLALAMRDHSIPKIDFLKVDTEGHDLFVLRGADWSKPPTVIVCEFEDRKTTPLGYSVQDLFAFLADKGYTVIVSEWEPIVEYGRQHTWKRFLTDPSQVAAAGWGNLIASRDPRFTEYLLTETIHR